MRGGATSVADREPPKFATDQWCWDYTREKVNANHLKKHGYELTYDDWEGKHFMAASAIYKRVVGKYGEGRQPEGIECPKCEEIREFAPGDYLCRVCRFGA